MTAEKKTVIKKLENIAKPYLHFFVSTTFYKCQKFENKNVFCFYFFYLFQSKIFSYKMKIFGSKVNIHELNCSLPSK